MNFILLCRHQMNPLNVVSLGRKRFPLDFCAAITRVYLCWMWMIGLRLVEVPRTP